MNRKIDTEPQAAAILNAGEIPAIAVQFNRRQDQIRRDIDVGVDAQTQFGFHEDAGIGFDFQALGGHPIDIDIGFQRALQPQFTADFEAGRGADDGNAGAEPAPDEQTQACVCRDM